jgi:hypothetical protein
MGKKMSLKKISTAALFIFTAILAVLTVTTAGLLSVSHSISSTGSITAINVGVYSNSACTQELTSIEWGTISPGNSETRIIYLKNTGNAQITLSMASANWNPANANGPITVTWNKGGDTLDVGQVATATLTLSVAESISGVTNFSFNIIITGTEN